MPPQKSSWPSGVAATLLVTAGDNPARLRSEPAFAMLCGTAPLPASSGRTDRHRLNRGGDRQANAALHRISKLQSLSAGKMSQAMKEWETLNEAFQETLMSGGSSLWLLNFRRTAYFYAKRYLRVCLSAAAIRDLQKDHRAMADAAIARDVAKLQGLIEDQLERIYRKIEASGKL